METPTWKKRLAENKLGLTKPEVPAFVYHGDVDDIIPLAVGEGLREHQQGGNAATLAVAPMRPRRSVRRARGEP